MRHKSCSDIVAASRNYAARGYTMARWICLGHGRHLTPLSVRQFSIGLTFVLMGALAAPAQAQTDDSNPCGKVPDASRYRVAPSVLPGYKEALDRWQACLSKRTQEIIQKAKEARDFYHDIRDNGGVETIGKEMTNRIDSAMGVASTEPSQLAKQGSKVIAKVYDTPAGGSGVAKVVGRTATTVALTATARAAANFDAALANAGGETSAAPPTSQNLFAPTFARIQEGKPIDRAEAFARSSASAIASSTPTDQIERQRNAYQSELAASRRAAAPKYSAYRANLQAIKDAQLAASMRQSRLEAEAAYFRQHRSQSSTSSKGDKPYDHSTELGGMDPK